MSFLKEKIGKNFLAQKDLEKNLGQDWKRLLWAMRRGFVGQSGAFWGHFGPHRAFSGFRCVHYVFFVTTKVYKSS
jgi:hypothetical protein